MPHIKLQGMRLIGEVRAQPDINQCVAGVCGRCGSLRKTTKEKMIKRLLVGAMTLVLGAVPVMAQSIDDLNIQIHGYATQGFVYTNQNNIFTMNSTNGSPAWTEAVMNVGAQPG